MLLAEVHKTMQHVGAAVLLAIKGKDLYEHCQESNKITTNNIINRLIGTETPIYQTSTKHRLVEEGFSPTVNICFGKPTTHPCLGLPPPIGSFFILDDKEANNQGCVSYVRNNTSIVLNRWMSRSVRTFTPPPS